MTTEVIWGQIRSVNFTKIYLDLDLNLDKTTNSNTITSKSNEFPAVKITGVLQTDLWLASIYQPITGCHLFFNFPVFVFNKLNPSNILCYNNINIGIVYNQQQADRWVTVILFQSPTEHESQFESSHLSCHPYRFVPISCRWFAAWNPSGFLIYVRSF